jgi:putative tryptophan/tyrosine transport system substrate-binding protein
MMRPSEGLVVDRRAFVSTLAGGLLAAPLAAENRLPATGVLPSYPRAGGLMGYGTGYGDLFRHSAVYVDKILRGARPGDLPIEQPIRFELVINRETAKALGLTIPPSLLQRADQVIDP